MIRRVIIEVRGDDILAVSYIL